MAKDYIQIRTSLGLKYYKGNIVATYTYNHKTFRYNLIKIDSSLFLPKVKGIKYNEIFTKKECEDAVKNINELLPHLKNALDDIVKTLNKDDSIKKEDVDKKINEYKNIITSREGLVADFTSWIEDLKKEKDKQLRLKGLKVKKNNPSLKDYKSTRNLLMDYEHDKCTQPLQAKDVNTQFLLDLVDYCYAKRPKQSNEEPPYFYKTKGDLTNKTINKRMDCLFTFLNKKYKITTKNVEKPKLELSEQYVIRLTREEVKKLVNLEIEDDSLKIARDYFVFLCYTGMRFSDFYKLDKTYYHEDTNEILFKATKTRAKCQIFVFDKAKEIGKKYDFSFRHFTNQALNRSLKELFEKYDLFSEEITVHYMQDGEKSLTQKKRDFLSCHTGRKTYISILAEMGLDVYDIMSTTGHKKIDTLKYYLDTFGPDRRKKFEKINESWK